MLHNCVHFRITDLLFKSGKTFFFSARQSFLFFLRLSILIELLMNKHPIVLWLTKNKYSKMMLHKSLSIVINEVDNMTIVNICTKKRATREEEKKISSVFINSLANLVLFYQCEWQTCTHDRLNLANIVAWFFSVYYYGYDDYVVCLCIELRARADFLLI